MLVRERVVLSGVLRTLRKGPAHTLPGFEPPRSVEEANANWKLWLSTWVAGPLQAILDAQPRRRP